MNPEQHEHWQQKLAEEERNLLTRLGYESDSYLGSVEARHENADDAAAQAKDEELKDRSLSLSESYRDRLDAVHEAQRRLRTGTYGLCANCEGEIPARRLEAVPYTQYCIHCEESMQ